MTYCVGLQLARGLVFMSDTRTNAGLDNFSSYRKVHCWAKPGERAVVLLSAGNLATTQAVVSLLDERTKAPAERSPSLLAAPTMFQIARLIGATLRDAIQANIASGQRADASFNATLIVGGQIAGSPPRLFLIYPEGNFIEAGADAPFFQTGETKYGRPILLRAFDPEMSFADAVKLLLVSFDSTIKANLSVGPPLDLQIYRRDTLELQPTTRIDADDAYFRSLSTSWGEALRGAFGALPDLPEDLMR